MRLARVYFERAALSYPLGKELYERFTSTPGVDVRFTTSHNQVRGLPGATPARSFAEAKRTLVVGVRRTLKFAACRPSAHYQLPLATGCPGQCRYCYLHTTLGDRPYLRVYVNLEEIFERARRYIKERQPQVTLFEGAATSDPMALEQFTGAVGRAVTFFAGQEFGRFRLATKHHQVEGLTALEHRGHSRIRFSVNTPEVITRYEQGTPGLRERLRAAAAVAAAAYPVGFIIAPVLVTPGWKEAYGRLLVALGSEFGRLDDLTLEVITHRFTRRARARIEAIFPDHGLPMDESDRRYRFGQFGYGKFVYPPEVLQEVREFFAAAAATRFEDARLEYVV